MSTEIEQSLTDYLAGYIAGRPENCQLIQTYAHWPRMAALELDRRAASLLEILPQAELRAIAAGDVDLAELVGRVQAKPEA